MNRDELLACGRTACHIAWHTLALAGLIGCVCLLTGGDREPPNTAYARLLDESHNRRCLAYFAPGDLVVIRLRVYEHRPFRWQLDSAGDCAALNGEDGVLEKPDGWIDGDACHQVFVLRVGRRGGRVRLRGLWAFGMREDSWAVWLLVEERRTP